VNVNGEVIGVNVAMRDGAQNIAFAINAGTVKDFLNKNFNAKRVAGIDHGIKCDEKIVAEVGDRQRVVVKNAACESIKAGDEIRAVGSLKIVNTFDVERALWHNKPGEKVAVKVVREGKEVDVILTLTASPPGAGQAVAVSRETPAAPNAAAATTVRSANER
jgi:serine protease Do